ncbi:hypothetical protein QBC46DRAFT_266328 [Diplogelasinospora grovesii]|uniref:Cyclin n=1 Tax=Diplogelasinospora grovesii TaxID=303347 RepID=A0AAN6N579_9PEZI|nr:hypothetical protein QBC46DRAFT_266328 [Diplogelasinospora grovesii]
MGTRYQMPHMAPYENHHMHRRSAYISTAAPSDRTRPALTEQGFSSTSHRNAPAQPHAEGGPHFQTLARAHEPSTISLSSMSASQVLKPPVSRQSTRPSTPTSAGTIGANPEEGLSTRDSAMVLHNLNIPRCISPRGGNLADFTAQITALFWFESIKVLEAAEKVRSLASTAPVRRLADSAVACPNFRKWVHSVLSTTQVTQNVILLALLFIYRLKVANPTVKGRAGSEYRLLTVALMLGNKFLDDNTYTNKTWAEVSGISVGEIHVMEVEFLSNMRYTLLASKEQWEEWLLKLAKFWEYLERAQRPASLSPLLIPSPTHREFVSPLPSPTGTFQLTPGLQPASHSAITCSPGVCTGNGGNQSWQAPYPVNNAVSPLALRPELHLAKKRSFAEEDPSEPPAKRFSRQVHPQAQAPPPASTQGGYAPSLPVAHPSAHPRPAPSAGSDQVRLSVPNLTLNTTPTNTTGAPSYPTTTYAPQQTSNLSLPPLVPGVRAMSTVFTAPTTTYAPQLPILTTGGPSIPTAAPSLTPTTAYPPTNYGTPTKRLSPQNALAPAAPYAGSSPLVESYSQHSLTPMGSVGGVHTPVSHSPSIYLQQRNSPYRPVRHVNTLLYPPPSAFLQQYHITNALPPAQMHYHPLGRRNELRTGVVPEYALHNVGQYSALGSGQHHALTPAPSHPMSHVLPNQSHQRSQPAHGGGRPTQSHFPVN